MMVVLSMVLVQRWGSSIFSENKLFPGQLKEPILISRQGNDANGAGKFSGEAGGMIKEYGSIFAEKGTAESYSPITYAANNKSLISSKQLLVMRKYHLR